MSDRPNTDLWNAAVRAADEIKAHGVTTIDDNPTLRAYVGQELGADTYTSYFDAALRRIVVVDKLWLRAQLRTVALGDAVARS